METTGRWRGSWLHTLSLQRPDRLHTLCPAHHSGHSPHSVYSTANIYAGFSGSKLRLQHPVGAGRWPGCVAAFGANGVVCCVWGVIQPVHATRAGPAGHHSVPATSCALHSGNGNDAQRTLHLQLPLSLCSGAARCTPT